MAVKKAAESAESEKEERAGESAVIVENAENEAQAQPQTGNNETDRVKLVYIGPSLPKAALKSNRIFEGTREEIKKELEKVLEKFPLVEKLLVPVADLAEKKDKARTAGNILNKYCLDIASAANALLEKEV